MRLDVLDRLHAQPERVGELLDQPAPTPLARLPQPPDTSRNHTAQGRSTRHIDAVRVEFTRGDDRGAEKRAPNRARSRVIVARRRQVHEHAFGAAIDEACSGSG
ncbi:MAG: hypothetical protein ACK55I_33110, partial [bacterium]